MDGNEFYAMVDSDVRMEWLGCLPAGDAANPHASLLVEDTVFVENLTGNLTQGHSVLSIPISTILAEEPEFLRGLILGNILPKPLRQICRIVGYFSDLSEWNRSKLAEMRDRRKGYKYIFGSGPLDSAISIFPSDGGLPQEVLDIMAGTGDMVCGLNRTDA